MFTQMQVQILNHPYAAVAVQNVTYPLWTSLKLTGETFRYNGNGDFTVNGKNVQGVVQGGNSYVPWSALGLQAQRVKRQWDFVKPSTTINSSVLASVPFVNAGEIWLKDFTFDGVAYQPVMLDTGNFETMFPQSYATMLNLPNNGPIAVGSSGGQSSAYKTTFNMTIGNETFSNLPGYVLPDSETQDMIVLGWATLAQNHISFTVNQQRNMVSFFK